MMDLIAIPLLLGGCFFLLVSSVGLLRLPDFFTRAHAVGKSETLGALLILLGLGLHSGSPMEGAKLLLIVFFIAVTNPTGIHALSRAALRKGVPIWTREGRKLEADAVLEATPGTAFDSPASEEGADR